MTVRFFFSNNATFAIRKTERFSNKNSLTKDKLIKRDIKKRQASEFLGLTDVI